MRQSTPILSLLGLLTLPLAACTTTSAMPDGNRPGGTCTAEPGQSFIGQRADAATGAAIQRATGAATLRWGPPDSAWTMDYRSDRVNVRYDRTMAITDVTCG